MNGLGDEFLARAALAEDQDVCGRIRDLPDRCVNFNHSSTVPDHFPEAQGLSHLLQKQGVVLFDSFCGQGVPNDPLEVLDREILFDIIVGPLFHRIDRRLSGGVGRDEDDHRFRG